MKRAADIAQSQKIYNCVDELLMEDIDYQFQLDKKEQKQLEKSSGLKRGGSRLQTNLTIKSSLRGNKSLISPDRKSAGSVKRTAKNLNESTSSKHQNPPKARFPTPKQTPKNSKPDSFLSDHQLKINRGLKLKRTVSHDPDRLQQIKQNELELQVEQESDSSYIGTREGSPQVLLSPGEKMRQKGEERLKISSPIIESNKQATKTQARGKKRSNFGKSPTKSKPYFSPFETILGQVPSPQFHLTHDQLQFLSLLYPNQTPQQLMIKLLSYNQQQLQYKNSFQEIAFCEQKKKRNYFFKSNANLSKNGEDRVKERQSQEQERQQQQQIDERFFKLPQERCVSTQTKQQTLNQYTRLKQQCLAALGSQMVQTQIKSSIVQMANVNYYTRQYAMPLILQLIQQKNQYSQTKLQKLIESPIHYDLGSSINEPHTFHALPTTYTSSSFPQQYIHKVHIPANSRGQCFQMDYVPQGKLFQYLSQNQYRRILRDINHLIQKVLLYHRHNSFLKKKNNSLLKGWNLVLIIFLISLLCLLYLQSLFAFQSLGHYIQIVSFFSLSFLLILIMGNAFNNYKKSIKRSSLIKDICQEITNYLQFANCSSKNIKWVLGKDFFWLEVWVYLRRGSGRVGQEVGGKIKGKEKDDQ